jgi:hypothetical protein
MKGTAVVDQWRCDLGRGTDDQCKCTSFSEMPTCVVCGGHICPSHRETVAFFVTQPYQETICAESETKVFVCANCRWPWSHAIKEIWPTMLAQLLVDCREAALKEKEKQK